MTVRALAVALAIVLTVALLACSSQGRRIHTLTIPCTHTLADGQALPCAAVMVRLP